MRKLLPAILILLASVMLLQLTVAEGFFIFHETVSAYDEEDDHEEEAYYSNHSGYDGCYALAIEKLSLRSRPDRDSADLGTYPVAGEYIMVDARHWDDANDIYWLHVSFRYNGSLIEGWTGWQRFDPDSYDIRSLPVYTNDEDREDDAYGGFDGCYALAIEKLSLRSRPNRDSDDLGTYPMAGEYILVDARHWDDANDIYWLHVSFRRNGTLIEGWTGWQRFDPDSYDIRSLPKQ